MTSETEEQASLETAEKATAESVERATPTKDRSWDLLVGLLPLLGMFPMLAYSAATLWSKDYLRFFPLTILGLVVLVGLKWPTARATENPYRRWTAIGILVGAVLFYALSLWQFSPWLSHVAFTMVFCAWALGRFGDQHWGTIAAWTTLLATSNQLPGNWNENILSWLQGTAAWGTTKALDALSVPCINNGMLIETREVSIMADEVCGGWSSVFAFVSFAVLLLIIQHRSAAVSVLVLLCVPMWVLLSHFLRLLAITLTFEYGGRDISVGWDFRLLELATAVLVLILIWMSASLFKRLLEPIPAADAEFGPIFQAVNKLFLWPQPDPLEEQEPEDEYEKKAYLRRKEKRKAQLPSWSPFDWHTSTPAVWTVRVSAAVLLLGAVLPLSRLFSQGVHDLTFGLPQLSSDAVLAYASEDALPAELTGGWSRISFDRIRRSPRSGFGEFGVAWNYVLGEKRISASVDFPFLGWHDPVAQRQLQGWTVDAEKVRVRDNWVWCESEMENELGGQAYSLYCLFTPDSKPYSRLPSRLSRGQSELEGVENLDKQSNMQVTYQFQVLIESGEQLSRVDQQRIRECFLELRDIARSIPSVNSAD